MIIGRREKGRFTEYVCYGGLDSKEGWPPKHSKIVVLHLLGCKGNRCESGTAPATVTNDKADSGHWEVPEKASAEDDLGVRRPSLVCRHTPSSEGGKVGSM